MCPGSLALAPFSLSSCVGFRSCRSVLFKFRQNRNYPQVCPWIKKRSGRQDVNDLLHVKKGSFAASVGVTYGIWSVGRKVFSSENAGLSPRDRGAGAKNSLRAQRDFFIWQHCFGADRAKKFWKRRLLDEIASSPTGGLSLSGFFPKGFANSSSKRLFQIFGASDFCTLVSVHTKANIQTQIPRKC